MVWCRVRCFFCEQVSCLHGLGVAQEAVVAADIEYVVVTNLVGEGGECAFVVLSQSWKTLFPETFAIVLFITT